MINVCAFLMVQSAFLKDMPAIGEGKSVAEGKTLALSEAAAQLIKQK